jgi:transposase
MVVFREWMSRSECSECHGDSEVQNFCDAYGLLRCPECNAIIDWDENAASDRRPEEE